MLMQLLISIILGLLPEVLYFTIFLIYTKNIKEKRLKLCILISIAYALCMFIQRYKTIYYLLFIILVYIILKILYKEKIQIIDIFIFSISTVYLTFISILCFYFVKEDFSNYYIMIIINKILLFIPLIFKNKFNIYYKKYCKLWNRNDSIKKPIKSITLRNISLILLNLFICVINIVCLYILNIS